MAMFTPTQKKNLAILLSSVASHEGVLTLDGLHGYMFGLAITPAPIAPSEWLPGILGEDTSQVDDEREAERLLKSLFSAYNRIIKQNQDGELSFPFSDPIKSKDVQRVQEWTRGLYQAISLCPEIWAKRYRTTARCSEPSEYETEVTSCFSVVVGITDPEKITEFIQRSQDNDSQLVKSTAEFLARLFVLLPKSVSTIQSHGNAIRDGLLVPIIDRLVMPTEPLRVEKVGRNDPCPCGSGSKYKKCCGK